MCHSRWLTLPYSILRLYASISAPSETLKTLANFIINVHAPTWFDIKCQPIGVNRPKNLWKIITRMQYLPETLRKKVFKSCSKKRCLLCESKKNVLISMINND